MPAQRALFGFLTPPDVTQGPNQNVAVWSLRLSAALTMVSGMVSVATIVYLSVQAMIGATGGREATQSLSWWPAHRAPIGGTLFVSLALLAAAVVVAGVFLFFLWWNNTAYLRLADGHKHAVWWASSYGAISAASGLFFGLDQAGLSWELTRNYLGFLLGLLTLVFVLRAHRRSEIDGTPPDG